MKKYIFLFFAVCAFSVYANAQNRTGDCTSYTSVFVNNSLIC